MNRMLALGLIAIASLALGACSMFGGSKSAAGKVSANTTKSGSLQSAAAGKPEPLVPGSAIRKAAAGSDTLGVPVASGQTSPDYLLGPLDVIEVKVFQLPDLDRTARIDQNGMVTLQLLGQVVAAGKTQSQLEAEIARLYAASYLQDPRVTVFVKEYGSQRITVAGAVHGPGVFVLTGPTTLLESVAMAKGLTDVASSSDIALIRFVNGQRTGKFYSLDEVVKGKSPDPILKGGDIVFVQTSGLRATMKELMQASPVLSIIGGF